MSGIDDTPGLSGHPEDPNLPRRYRRSVLSRVGICTVDLSTADVGWLLDGSGDRGPGIDTAKDQTRTMVLLFGHRTPKPISSPSQSSSDCQRINLIKHKSDVGLSLQMV
jgi:hypothetical protein